MKTLKKAFTLLEVIVALSLFEFVMIGVIMAVNKAYAYVQSTKIQVMAVNLAREGVEQMYTIRDTNRRKHSAEKDKYWLLMDPLLDNDSIPTGTPLISSGVYTLHMKASATQQYPILLSQTLTGGRTIEDLYDKFDKYTGNQEIWRMPFTGGFYSGSTLVSTLQELMESDAKFYRIVRVWGLYNKTADKDSSITCPTVDSSLSVCNNDTPKELRFCVKVWYLFTSRGSTELCGVMTNFRE
jgi:type II secretory pathway pseudopilin PulG